MNEIFIALISVIGAAIVAAVVSMLQRRKQAAEILAAKGDAAESLSRAASDLIKPYQEEVIRLRSDVVALREELVDARVRIAALEQELGTARPAVSKLEKDLGDAQSKIATLEAVLVTARKKIEVLEVESLASNARIAMLESENEKLMLENDKLYDAYKAAGGRFDAV